MKLSDLPLPESETHKAIRLDINFLEWENGKLIDFLLSSDTKDSERDHIRIKLKNNNRYIKECKTILDHGLVI